ncbi:hypothetical protein WR25_09116 [Diploscapter pachys]|uniref:DUF38 domain-containing protein n=1 Tax=Diploscapter pachys TaxID=2018661 RepID=A0A2A2LPF3_9BILA|nr:hypothetical protein WR25_09116 [Diploscapter pachys]
MIFLIVKFMLISLQALGLYSEVIFRRADDADQWNCNSFFIWFEGGCKCVYVGGRTQEIEPGLLNQPSLLYDRHLLRGFEDRTKFIIENGPLDDAVINCAKLINILTKFCVVHKFDLSVSINGHHMWNNMNAFFNANPPDLRIQPIVSINSRINLDSLSIFPNGLAKISIHSRFKPILVDAYHEVFRRTPDVSFYGLDLPYTYEDLFGFFKDIKKLSLRSAHHITKQQLGQLVQNFHEVKHDEECRFTIGIDEDFLVNDLLTLIPKEAYRLNLKRSGNIGPEPEKMIWAEMTDRFGGTWALREMGMHNIWERGKNIFHICSMKYFTENEVIELSDQSDSDQSDSDQSYSYESYSDQSDFD